MSLEVARAIVGGTHAHGLIVSVHLSGPEGAALALDAGVDEWAAYGVTRSRAIWPPGHRRQAHGVRTQLDVLSAATARGGEHRGLAPLGQLIEGAPADLIGVRGNPLEQFKPLEYPDLVVSGGVTIAGLAGH